GLRRATRAVEPAGRPHCRRGRGPPPLRLGRARRTIPLGGIRTSRRLGAPRPQPERGRPGRPPRVSGQHAAHHRDTYLAPDWAAVAAAHDAVHLSWAGFLTTEGFVSVLSGGAVAMLRYWGSERTLWLCDCLGDPTPLEPAAISDGDPERAPDLRA